MAVASGKFRDIEIETSLGTDVLLLEGITGHEELGRLFEYTIDLVSERSDIKPETILGTNVTVAFETGKKPKYLNGYVTRFWDRGLVRTAAFPSGEGYGYRVQIHPWLWLATRRSDCRIFNNLNVPDIVTQVLGFYGGEIELKLSQPHDTWTYCVQYRETDFNFVSRLLEQEGIYYFFLHENGRHKLVLADSSGAHTAHPDFGTFRFVPLGHDPVSEDDYIDEWSAVSAIQSGRFLHKGWDFFKARAVEGAAADPAKYSYGDLQVYDCPSGGIDSAGSNNIIDRTVAYAGVRIDELKSREHLFNGAGNTRGLEVGRRFRLAGHPNGAHNGEYLVVSTSLSASVSPYASGGAGGSPDFRLSFVALPAARTFRPERVTPKPLVHGAQTALVVGGGEIDTDEFGRVQLKFHWDTVGGVCWARVAQLVAGNKWGAFFIPRVGQEVVVEFLEGDPDHPVVTGVLYNGVAKPPYDLPGEKTKSTIKTNSSTGGGGFNELRFEDKKGSEQIFIHAERQLDERIKQDRLAWVGRDTHLIVQENRKEKVGKDQHLEVAGDLSEKVAGIASLKVDQNMQYKVGMRAALDAGQEIHLKAGMNVVVEAGTRLSLKVGGSFIDMNPGGIFISGPMVYINSGGSAGSGSGSSPKSPQAPTEADDGKPGKTDSPPEKQKPPPAQSYSPKAVALKEAAKTGAPFCDLG